MSESPTTDRRAKRLPPRWSPDQEGRFRRMIQAARLIQRYERITVSKLQTILNEAYGYDVGVFALLRDIGTLEALGLIKRPTLIELVFTGDRNFWPFGGDV